MSRLKTFFTSLLRIFTGLKEANDRAKERVLREAEEEVRAASEALSAAMGTGAEEGARRRAQQAQKNLAAVRDTQS
ncbi:hypothetical protein FJY90_00090 [Candidatus Gottesmanbacteria bacterium]|nr:hypothetical protein [Candidatus Gottesmanbacteria bacterium]